MRCPSRTAGFSCPRSPLLCLAAAPDRPVAGASPRAGRAAGRVRQHPARHHLRHRREAGKSGRAALWQRCRRSCLPTSRWRTFGCRGDRTRHPQRPAGVPAVTPPRPRGPPSTPASCQRVLRACCCSRPDWRQRKRPGIDPDQLLPIEDAFRCRPPLRATGSRSASTGTATPVPAPDGCQCQGFVQRAGLAQASTTTSSSASRDLPPAHHRRVRPRRASVNTL